MALSYALRRVICSVYAFFASFLLDSLLVSAGNNQTARLVTEISLD